jgi:hypothetical protein
MAMEPLTFSADDVSAPTGPLAPTAKEVQAIGAIGLDLAKRGRETLMNQIGLILGIPRGGWHGQAKLFERGDVRLVGYLHIMANEHQAKLIADNLDRAGHYTHANVMMALVIAAREHHSALTARGTHPIDSYSEGGLDFLGVQRDHLGLPHSLIKNWIPMRPRLNPETMRNVIPAWIPARDQMIAYAAQEAASFRTNFKHSLKAEFGDDAELALARASRGAMLVWQAYAFLSPGGRPYDPTKKLREQLGQGFGHRSALSFYAHRSRQESRKPNLDDILSDKTLLVHLAWFQSAKTRAAETLFLERLLKRARQLLPS